MSRASILFALIPFAALWMSAPGCEPATSTKAEATSAGNRNAGPANDSPPVRVPVVKPQRKTLYRTTVQPGHLDAFEQTPLFAKVSGYVEKLHVDIGDRVTKNQVLVELWIPEMLEEMRQKEALVARAEAQVEQAAAALPAAMAALASAEARLTEAEAGIGRAEGEYQRWKSEHARIAELAANDSVNRRLVDETLNQFRATEAARREAAAKVESARAAIGEKEANIEQAKADRGAAEAHQRVAEAELARTNAVLQYASLRAPFDGVVTERNIHTGHLIQSAQGGAKPLLVVARTDIVRVFVDVPEAEAAFVLPESAAVVRVQALKGQEIEGTVTRTAWNLNPASRTLRTEIDIRNDDGRLRAGMYATVRIVLEVRPDVLTLPASAIITRDGNSFCYSLVEGRVVRKPVMLGLHQEDDVEVLTGVTDDEQVVRTGAAALTPGQTAEAAMSDAEAR